MLLAELNQADFGLVEFPAGCDVAAVLVAVGVAEHHFLHAAPAVDESPVLRSGEQAIHDFDAIAQIRDGFEQRNDVDGALTVCRDQTGLLQQYRQTKQVRYALRIGDDGSCNR